MPQESKLMLAEKFTNVIREEKQAARRQAALDRVSAGDAAVRFYALLKRVDDFDRELGLDMEEAFNAALCDLAREVLG